MQPCAGNFFSGVLFGCHPRIAKKQNSSNIYLFQDNCSKNIKYTLPWITSYYTAIIVKKKTGINAVVFIMINIDGCLDIFQSCNYDVLYVVSKTVNNNNIYMILCSLRLALIK
jgi:hypothetical protein